MSMELDVVIEHCVTRLTQNPPLTRDEISALLKSWEDAGLINMQMRVIIIRQLRASQAVPPASTSEPA
jgi:hypothetical protein